MGLCSKMHDFIQFVAKHWLLWLTLISAFLLLLREEGKGGQGHSTSIDAQHVVQKLNQGAVIYDLRDKAAFEKGHILGAKHLDGKPLLGSDLPDFPKDKPVVLVCDTGNLSAMAATRTNKQGHFDVCSLQGGIAAWKSAGLPLTTN